MTGLNPLGFATIEGFVKGLPLKLLLIGFVTSEDLGLGFRGRAEFGFAMTEEVAEEDLLQGRAELLWK